MVGRSISAIPDGHNKRPQDEKDKSSRSFVLVGHPGCSLSVKAHSSACRAMRQNAVHLVRLREHSVLFYDRKEKRAEVLRSTGFNSKSLVLSFSSDAPEWAQRYNLCTSSDD